MKTMLLSDLIVMRRNLIQMTITCILITLIIACAMNNTLAVIGGCFGAMIPLLYLFSIAAYDDMNEWQTFRLTLPVSRRSIMAGRYASMLVVVIVSILLGVAFSYLVGFVVGLITPQTAAEFSSSWNYTNPSGEFLSTLTLASNPPEVIWGSAIGGAAMALFLSAITLPLVAKVGLTKGTRYVPVVAVVLFLIAFATFGEGGPLAAYVPNFFQWLFGNDQALALLIAGLAGISLIAYAVSLVIAIKLYETRQF